MKSAKTLTALAATLALSACATFQTSKPTEGTAMETKLARTPNSQSPDFVRHDFAPGELMALCDGVIKKTETRLDQIARLATPARTFQNTVLEFENAIADLHNETVSCVFMGYVSTDKSIRAEGAACMEKLGPFGISVMTRKDLFDALKDARPSSEDEKRLHSEILRDFRKNGLNLSEDKLAQVKKLNQEISVLSTQFTMNLNNDVTALEFSREELKGVSDDFIGRLEKAPGGKLVVTTKAADFTHVMENARNAETRKHLMVAYYNRQADKNVEILERILELRQKVTALMGYKTWADFRTEDRMAKSGTAALEFLNGLKGKLAERYRQDMRQLLEFKKELEPEATKIDAWDLSYLPYQLKKRDYEIDPLEVMEYFPVERVIHGAFSLFSGLFGVEFNEIQGVNAWAKGVKLYEIRDSATREPVSYFYMDLYPREGKYSHFAAFSLLTGRETPKGYDKPVSAIVANFNPPTQDKPSLLKHSEVKTFFHELGHILHQTLTKAPYSRLAGTSVARDFVEVPSQLLENWIWLPEVLTEMSGHYSDESKKLPGDLIERMIRAKDFNQGSHYTRQLMLGLLDLTYHTTSGPMDTTAIHDRTYREILGIDPPPGTHFQAGFNHLIGYDAGYYGYIWSEVFALDVFSRFEQEGVRNPKVGRDYRRIILERGKMQDARDLLREFLGREPNSDAFFRKLGLDSDASAAGGH